MSLLQTLRKIDDAVTGRGDRRHILVDSRTGVNYEMVAPVVRAMRPDSRVRFYFTASEDAARLRQIYEDAPAGTELIGPRMAALSKWDAYLASDFMWATLPRGARRIQMFHGVGGKYGFDAPTESMRVWDRLFFVNERRLRNFIAAGALDADGPQARLIGMPKVDCLVDGSMSRARLLEEMQLDPARPTVLYAPTWSPNSSLNRIGEALIGRLAAMPINLIVKLHDRSRDLRPQYSGGIDWVARLTPLLQQPHTTMAMNPNITPSLVAADVMITDHSSCGFEYLLLDRPLVRIHVPELIAGANIHADYVQLLADASHNVSDSLDAAATVAAVEQALGAPSSLSAARQRVANDLFYRPGTATARCAAALYELLELAPASGVTTEDAACLQSA